MRGRGGGGLAGVKVRVTSHGYTAESELASYFCFFGKAR